MKWLVFYDTPGQMCNRFWSYIDSVGWAIENNARVIVLFWDSSIKDFKKLRNNKYIKFPMYSPALIGLFGENRYLEFLKRLITNRYLRFVYRHFLKRYVNAVRSYDLHNNHRYYPKHLEKIVDIFSPSSYVTEVVDVAFQDAHREGFKVVGVHVRRGDYKNWRGGVLLFLR